jgi:single-strand DNA-binding protein
MAFSINNITICGNITKDPELRFTPSGNAVASFAIAVNRSVRDKNTNEWVENVDFFNIVTWFRLAENCAESLKKGDRVIVSGRLSQRSWEDKEGQKKYVVEIIASNVGVSLEFASCDIRKNPKSEPAQTKDDGIDFTDDDIPF